MIAADEHHLKAAPASQTQHMKEGKKIKTLTVLLTVQYTTLWKKQYPPQWTPSDEKEVESPSMSKLRKGTRMK